MIAGEIRHENCRFIKFFVGILWKAHTSLKKEPAGVIREKIIANPLCF